MHFFYGFVVFMIVLFVYMHVMETYKTSEKIQLYEMDYTDNPVLQSACNVKQPIVFEFRHVFAEFFYRQTPQIYLEQIGLIDVALKDTDDYWMRTDIESVDYVVISYKSMHSLIRSDARGHYISEGNCDFVADANLGNLYRRLDEYLKPAYACHTGYDIVFGSKLATFPMRYHTHDRIFLCVLSGKISVRMATWKSSVGGGGRGEPPRFPTIIRDYENYEFRVRENPWKPEGDVFTNFQTRYLDFTVLAGQILFIPAYWFYSIRLDETDTILAEIKYNSPINMLANAWDIGKWYLQQKNIERVGGVVADVGPTGLFTGNSEISDPISPQISESSKSSLEDSLEIITKK